MKRIELKLQNRFFNICFIFGIIVLLAIPFWHVNVRSIPYVYNDEFGYWASAANFAGLDWSETFSKISYYSYGYGIILAILIMIFNNMALAYKVAIILNGIWLMLSFIFLYKSARILYPKINKIYILIVSFTATIFSSNIAESNYTWPEVFLFFLFSVTIYLAISVIRNPGKINIILLGIISIYSFYVHQRTLGISIAVFLLVMVLIIFKKIGFKELLYFIIPIIIFGVIFSLIKSDVIDSVWLNGETVDSNNFSGQIEKIISIFSFEGIMKIFLSFCGKLYYVFAATFLLVPLGLVSIWKNWILSKAKINISDSFFIGAFLSVAFLFTMGINTIFMMTPGNVTHIVYGRYTDNLLGIFLIIGIIEFWEYGVDIKINLSFLALFSFFSLAVYYAVGYFGLQYRAAINAIGISYIVEENYIEIWKGICFILGVWFVLQFIRNVLKNKRKMQMICICGILAISFVIIGLNAYSAFEVDWGSAAQSSEKSYEIINTLQKESGKDIEVYAIMEETGYPLRHSGNGIQFLLKDKTVHSISMSEALEKEWSNNDIILASARTKVLSGFSVIYMDDTYEIMVEQGSNLYELAKQKDYFYENSQELLSKERADELEDIISFVSNLEDECTVYYVSQTNEEFIEDVVNLLSRTDIEVEYGQVNELRKNSDAIIINNENLTDIFTLLQKDFTVIKKTETYTLLIPNSNVPNEDECEQLGINILSEKEVLKSEYFQQNADGTLLSKDCVNLPFGKYKIISIIEANDEFRGNFIVSNSKGEEQYAKYIYKNGEYLAEIDLNQYYSQEINYYSQYYIEHMPEKEKTYIQLIDGELEIGINSLQTNEEISYIKEDSIISTGRAGVMAYGGNQVYSPGRYEMILLCEVEEDMKEPLLATVRILQEDNSLATYNITQQDLEKNDGKIIIPFEVYDYSPNGNVSLEISVAENVFLSLNRIYVRNYIQ